MLQSFLMKSNWLKYLVAIALLINAATLAFFWLNRPIDGENRPKARPGRVLIEDLKMDGKQEALFRPLRDQHHQTHDSLLQIIADQRQILYSQKQGVNDTILQRIGVLQAQIERITYDHFKDVRKICTPEQQVQLDTLLGKTVQRILTPKDKKRPHEREN
jgi:periplasmic protein CpxP/Spy